MNIQLSFSFRLDTWNPFRDDDDGGALLKDEMTDNLLHCLVKCHLSSSSSLLSSLLAVRGDIRLMTLGDGDRSTAKAKSRAQFPF